MTPLHCARENLRHIPGEYVLLGIKIVVHENTGGPQKLL